MLTDEESIAVFDKAAAAILSNAMDDVDDATAKIVPGERADAALLLVHRIWRILAARLIEAGIAPEALRDALDAVIRGSTQ